MLGKKKQSAQKIKQDTDPKSQQMKPRKNSQPGEIFYRIQDRSYTQCLVGSVILDHLRAVIV